MSDIVTSKVAENVPEQAVVNRVVAALKDMNGKSSEFKAMMSVTVDIDNIVEAVQIAKDIGFNMISDVFGIDYLTYPSHKGKRFAVVYNLYSIAEKARIFIRINLDEGEAVPTITNVWGGANFMEREVYDMFGIEFLDHPDLRKLLTPEDLVGHPHRKDFPIGETPTQFNDGRYIEPAAFRAGLTGMQAGLTGHKGGLRGGSVHGIAQKQANQQPDIDVSAKSEEG